MRQYLVLIGDDLTNQHLTLRSVLGIVTINKEEKISNRDVALEKTG